MVINEHILRLLSAGDTPYLTLRMVVERDLGIGKVDFCRAINKLRKTGQVDLIVPDPHKQFKLLRISPAPRRAGLIELTRRAAQMAMPPATVKPRGGTARTILNDPLGRWWLQSPSRNIPGVIGQWDYKINLLLDLDGWRLGILSERGHYPTFLS